MDCFIEMSIDELLKLQQDLRKIDDFKGKLNDDDHYFFEYHMEFFRDISSDIDCKLYQLNKDDDDDD